jgi:hypothetical protein
MHGEQEMLSLSLLPPVPLLINFTVTFTKKKKKRIITFLILNNYPKPRNKYLHQIAEKTYSIDFYEYYFISIFTQNIWEVHMFSTK